MQAVLHRLVLTSRTRWRAAWVLAVLTAIFGPSPARGQDEGKTCNEHPPVTRKDGIPRLRGARDYPPENLGGSDCAQVGANDSTLAAATGALLYNKEAHCSAVLVSPAAVVTAAHCVFRYDTAKLSFQLGRDPNRPLQSASVADVVLPRGRQAYDPTRHGVNDVAVVRLAQRITEAPPVTLADHPLLSLPGSAVYPLLHVSYGVASNPRYTRRCVHLSVKDACESAFSTAYSTQSCHGDSGGGLFRDGRLVGITSWGDADCQAFGVAMDAAVHQDFIRANLPANTSALPPAPVEKVYLRVKPSQLQIASDVLGDFEVRYARKFVRWTGTLREQREQPDGRCRLTLEAPPWKLYLHDLSAEACALVSSQSPSEVAFEGRLVASSANGLHLGWVSLARPPVASAAGDGTASYTLIGADVAAVETRSTAFRLESSHGYWSPRVESCEQISVPAAYRLGHVDVQVAYENHAGRGPARVDADQRGFCVPLWAQGFGGLQALGATLDHGNKGVISGAIRYELVREGGHQERVLTAGRFDPAHGADLTWEESARDVALLLGTGEVSRRITMDECVAGLRIAWLRPSRTVSLSPDPGCAEPPAAAAGFRPAPEEAMVTAFSFSGRIIQGQRARPGQFPSAVALVRKNKPREALCGATLVGREWLATAAHCAAHRENLAAVIGEVRLRDDLQPAELGDWCLHAKEDLALVKLAAPATAGRVAPLLPSQDRSELEGHELVAAGWGETESNARSTELLYVPLTVPPQANCRNWHGAPPLEDTRFCAGGGRSNRDVCYFDSGGPGYFAAEPDAGHEVLAGTIIGGNPGCGQRTSEFAFLPASGLADWIQGVMKEGICPKG